jgi:hypothetical protein
MEKVGVQKMTKVKSTKYYLSKTPLQFFVKLLEEAGVVVEGYDKKGGHAKLCHSKIYFWDLSDEGMGYGFVYESKEGWLEDLKIIQRIFAKAAQVQVHHELELEQKEERKKGTSEVSEFISGTSDSVHGGDSASGEVPDGESGRGQDSPSSGEPALPQDEVGSGQEERSAQSSDAPSLSPDLSSKEEGESCASDSSEHMVASEGEGSSGDGACPKSLECASPSQVEARDASMDGQASIEEGTGSLAPLSSEDLIEEIPREEEPGELSTLPSPSGAEEGEAPEPEREEFPSFSFKDLRKIMDRGQDTPSVQSRYAFGGVFADMESLYGIPPKALVERARQVFARLVSEYGEGNEGPRWDYKKVSTRIASYQNRRVSDRKKEVGRPAIAVLPDTSGSMSEFANQVLELSKVLMALGVPGAEVITVVQSNGYPLELWVNNKKIESFDYYQWERDDVYNWYKDIFRCWNVKVVILAADWDGEWLYVQLAEEMSIKIYWLDVYLSSKVYPTLAKQFPPKWDSMKWSIMAIKKIKYVYGCRDAVDFVKGLELAIRSKK